MTGHAVPPSVSDITAIWRDLNNRYFGGALQPIGVVWSRRLTASAGMFVSRAGPRSAWRASASPKSREIRLSLPLLTPLLAGTPYGIQELVSTLAHEMIHQWQFDVLKRRPNHGPDFLRKMTEMNRDGALAVTIYHSLRQEVLALSRFAWRCGRCGRIYRRQRRTIQPRHHHCGSCRGALHELPSSEAGRPSSMETERVKRPCVSIQLARQLELDFSSASL
ncbi:MAG TPA: SprT-like domain-containing protein [Nitrospira sp.]|nr:SprT-like domain-containing protein [Nitrospira sp.]